MSTYIEKEALFKILSEEAAFKIRHSDGSKFDVGRTNGIIVARDIANEQPPADVAPVRHGNLISTGYDELYCDFGNCTLCGEDQPTSNKFCCNCGAKLT